MDYGANCAKKPKPVTYTRLWGETVFFYRISKRKRVVELLGTSSWDQLEAAIQDNAEKNKQAMQRLKNAAAAVVKSGGHHVSDAQGMDGLESVVVTVEQLDILQDAGLLDPKAIIDNGDK